MAINANSESSSNANDRARWLAIQTNFAKVSKAFNAAGLVIGSSEAEKVKIANTVYYFTSTGALAKKASAEVAIAGTVANGKFNCWLLSMDDAGTVTATLGTVGDTLAKMVIPEVPDGEISLGIVIVNPTGTGDFVGGTTELADATVAPNAVYIDTYDPTFYQLEQIS
jgi:hypothetical protein